MVFPSRRPQSFKPVSTSGSVISMTIAIILVLISAGRGEGLAKKVRQFFRGQVYRELLWLHVVAIIIEVPDPSAVLLKKFLHLAVRSLSPSSPRITALYATPTAY
jgi:hypothetical protein